MIRLAAMLALATLATGCSHNPEIQGSKMSLRGYAFPPPAFKHFCAAEPGLCSTSGNTAVVQMTPGLKHELETVNKSINARITERDDRLTSGRPDDWRIPSAYGDCEDFAILKKQQLLKRGWPASAMLLTVARYGGQGHTILTVTTDKGDLVLDNRTNAIRDWSHTPYKYFARQSRSNGRKWERIGAPQPLPERSARTKSSAVS